MARAEYIRKRTATATTETVIVWRPQAGPQKALVDCPLPEIFYGGARGGGKTDGILGKWGLKAKRLGSKFNAVFFRKEMPQQDDLIERSKQIYGKLGAQWHEQQKRWSFANGALVRFRPLDNIADAEKYQGQNLSDACVEEAGNYAESAPIDRLFGCLRGSLETQLILTGNPGGPGHQWIKARYIDPAPMGMKVLTRHLPNGAEHKYVFIPSKVENNRILLAQDPGYVNRLYLVGSDALVKAWLEGDWNVVEGAFFDCWQTAKHVVRPFPIPADWLRIRSADWGFAKPFSVGWWAVVSDDYTLPDGHGRLPRGCLVRYREWYGATGPNEGLRLTAEEVAQGITLREAGEKISLAVLDPSAFAQNGGPSIAERMFTQKVIFRAADNTRVSARGALSGWDAMRARMKGDEDGNPMIVCFSTCTDSIRTIPVLQHDPLKAEDLDTEGEDHAADEWRYACLSRPWIPKVTVKEKGKTLGDGLTINDLWKLQRPAQDRRRI